MTNAASALPDEHLTIVSGIPAGESGTGRFVSHLRARVAEVLGKRVNLIARPERPARWQVDLWIRNRGYPYAAAEVGRYVLRLYGFLIGAALLFFRPRRRMILLHPQNLGFRLALRLIESRSTVPLMYLLDSSFFCVASYNHVRGENGPCLRCIDYGLDQVAKNGCTPFPRPDPEALSFVRRLQQLVKEGRVRIAAQNRRQAELAQRQFNLASPPPVVGLWAQDWDDVIHEKKGSTTPGPVGYQWDVLFHGHCLDAKGASWTAQVAVQCPELRFMFPFSKPAWFEAPDNCTFLPCSWESSLPDELGRSRLVFVPSLWSASIEGALVKSIAHADAVAVAENATGYSNELPPGLVLKLSAGPSSAAAELKRALDMQWRPDPEVKSAWLAAFVSNRVSFVPKLLHATFGVDP